MITAYTHAQFPEERRFHPFQRDMNMQNRLVKPGNVIGLISAALLVSGLICFAAAPSKGVKHTSSPHQPHVNIGISRSMFSGIAQENAVSSLKIWADTILKKRGIHLGSNPRIYNSQSAMKQDLQQGNVDFLAMLTLDYLDLENEVSLSDLQFSMYNEAAEEYVLIIKRDSGINNLSNLKDKSIMIQTGFRESLSPIWLDTILMKEGLDEASSHFGTIEYKENLLKTVLSVFFGKTDACLVTRNGIERMVEMNPQISCEVRVLYGSQELVPSLFCMRSNYNPMLKNEFLSALHALDRSRPGRKVLHMFQAEKLISSDASYLDNTKTMINTYLKLKTERSKP